MNRRRFLSQILKVPVGFACSKFLAGQESVLSLKFPPLPEIELPEVHSARLSNGIRVFLVENHELPLVDGFLLVRTGNLFDPPDKIGLADLTGQVLRTGGTSKRTGDELDEELENIAASIESSIGETSGEVSFGCLSEHLDHVLQLLAELLAEPMFREDKLELAKTRLRSMIVRRNDNPSAIASREFRSLVYGKDTPYGWIVELEHVDRIARTDLLEFYHRYFFPENVLLGIHGNFESKRLLEKLENTLGKWQSKKPPVPPFPEVKAVDSSGVYVADKPESEQTFFRLGHLGGTLKDPDFPALDVMADILGGGFNSRLFRRVRTELGYAYAIGASWSAAYNHPGLFTVGGSTRTEKTLECLKEVVAIVEGMRQGPPQPEEIRYAKEKVLNSFVFNFDTPAKTLYRLMVYEYYGYPRDFIFRYQRGVEATGAADVHRVASRRIHPENFTIVTVGPAKAFRDQLKALGLPMHDIDLTIKEVSH